MPYKYDNNESSGTSGVWKGKDLPKEDQKKIAYGQSIIGGMMQAEREAREKERANAEVAKKAQEEANKKA